MSDLIITTPDLPGIHIELEFVTPERAAQLLKTNHIGQRSMTAGTVEKYASDMETGDWLFAGDPVRVNKEGVLVDGQHRLASIEYTGIGQWIMVISGLDQEVMMAIDGGRRRSVADQLKMEHKQRTGQDLRYPVQVAGTLSAMMHWDWGNYGDRGVGRKANAQHLNSQPSQAQLFTLKRRIETDYQVTFEHAVVAGMRAASLRPGIFATSYALMWLLLTPINREVRERFFFELTTEDPTVIISSPVQGLKNRLLRKGKNEKWARWLQLHWMIQVVTAMANDQEIGPLRTPPTVRWDLLANLDDIPKQAS